MNPKKILIIGHTNTMGGVETFIRNTTLHSDKNKVEFYFLIHGFDRCLFQDEINAFYGENHFYFIPRLKSSPVKTLTALNRFYKGHHSFDFIHLQTGSASELVYCYPYCRKYQIRLITHSHNGGNLNSFIDHQAFIKTVNRVSDIKLACSRAAAVYMFGEKAAKEALVIPVGIDIEKFRFSVEKRNSFRKQFRISGASDVIGVVGRFTKQKNQIYAVRIFERYLKMNPDTVLILKGKGELEDELQKLIHDLKIEESVRLINDLKDMSAMYSAIDVFLMPSLFEGLPQAAIEAQASGLPCVFSSQISKEVNLTENNCMVSLSAPPEAWCRALHHSIRSGVNREEGFRSVKNKGYDIYDTVKSLERVYGV